MCRCDRKSLRHLPGCVSTGETLEEVKRNIQEAVGFHLDGMREDGEPIPEPSSQVTYAKIPP
jgi:predicted RNase H-like HicB family nuclease